MTTVCPALHGDENQGEIIESGQPPLVDDRIGELGSGQTVDLRDRIRADERLELRIEHMARSSDSAEWVRSIEHDKRQAGFGGRLHRKPHRRDVGVVTGPDALQVVDERVEPLEHLRSRRSHSAVQAVHRHPSGGIETAGHGHAGVEIASGSMLGSKDGRQI